MQTPDIKHLALDCTCADIPIEIWNIYMENKQPYPYKKAVQHIKKLLPKLYTDLSLDLRNPWEDDTYITSEHLIITHSAIEYFISYQ